MIRRPLLSLVIFTSASLGMGMLAVAAPLQRLEMKASADLPKLQLGTFLTEKQRHGSGYAGGRDGGGAWPFSGKNRAQRARLLGAFAHMA